MDRFVQTTDDRYRMLRHLRLLPPLPEGPTYVVGRTRHATPGTPYVVAQCVDEVAAVLALAGHETYRRDRMLAEPALTEALERWEAHDHRAHTRERTAGAAFRRIPSSLRSSPHPSVVGKLLP
jgi:hypothetical protein